MFSVDYLLKGAVAPAVAALLAALIFRALRVGPRGVGALAFGVGQATGLALTLDWAAAWPPSRNLQWVPWVGLIAAMLGPTVVAPGLHRLERWWLTALAATAAAIVLVPTWPDLWPPRLFSIAAFAGVVTLVTQIMNGLASRVPPRWLVLSMAGSAVLAGLLIAASLSLSVGEAALTTAAALMGTTVVLLFRADEAAVRGLGLPFVLTVGGWCYVTAIEPPPPEPPLVGLLFLPALPAMFWLLAMPPMTRWNGRVRAALAVLLWVLAAGAITAWVWFGTGGDAEADWAAVPQTVSQNNG